MEQLTNQSQADEEIVSIDIARYFAAVRKYKWVILAIVAVSITVAVFYTSRQTKIYQATASVQIEPKLPDAPKIRDIVGENHVVPLDADPKDILFQPVPIDPDMRDIPEDPIERPPGESE